MQKYKPNFINKKTIVLATSGLLLTLVVIVGASLYIPGKMHRDSAGMCAADVRNIPKGSKLISRAVRTDSGKLCGLKKQKISQDLDPLCL